MRQYSSDRVKVSFFGVDLTEGLASGTFLQEAHGSSAWSFKPNGLGGIVRMFDPNRSGQLSLQVDAESRTNQVLITFHNADLITRSVAGPLIVNDLSTREITYYNKAFILNHPNNQKATTSTVLTWSFGYERFIRQGFGFDNNVVGN